MNESPWRTAPVTIKSGKINFPIRKNSIRCKLCDTICTSRHVHDFVTCECGKVSADGGREYFKRCGNQDDYEELSVVGE